MTTLNSIQSANHTEVTSGARAIRLWLLTIAALVFAMVVVGGATRLTGSGLSITEWQPIMGTLPPLSDAAWQDAFHKYQQIPQYQILNKGMSLSAFKSIYWWEWSHRLLGRLLGVAFLLPLLVFIARRQVGRDLGVKLVGLFVLGGLQGALGWYMVKSGLIDRTEVSQYRLAAHLLLASALLAALLWTALDVARPDHRIRLKTTAAGSTVMAAVIAILVFVQLGAGALVAGLKAGLLYNTWPLMNGSFIPPDIAHLQPHWLNMFENPSTAQFDHRLIAYLIAALVAVQAYRLVRTSDDERIRISSLALLGGVALQIALGIATLLLQVPLHLALSHQAVAVLVLCLAVWHLHTLARA